MESNFLQKLVKKPERISNLNYDDFINILHEARKILEQEYLLLEFNADNNELVYVIGDIHGSLESLLELYDIIKKEKPKLVIFLGDIVDRGPKQLECLIFVLILKLINPNNYFILRGNHETLEMNQIYGFVYEFAQKYENYDNFKEILAIYDVLPICAIINNSILCLHGGIPQDFEILTKLKTLKAKDLNHSLSESLGPGIFQIMWNDPKAGLRGFMNSYRGAGIFFYGEEVFENFMKKYNLKYLIRAHECFPEGYAWFFENRLLSIFSAANYGGYYNPNPLSYAIIKNNHITPVNLELPLK